MVRKCHNLKLQTNAWHRHTTITKHQEDKLSQATSSLSLWPIKMIAKLECKLSHLQQNIDQLQTATMGATMNNKPTTTEPQAKDGQQSKPLWDLNAFYRYQIFALDSAVVKVQEMFSSHVSLLTKATYQHGGTL